VSLPASKTASTLLNPIGGMRIGDTITGFHLIGQIESAGAAATLDCNLRKLTAAAADNVDSSVGSMAQLAVTAQTKVDENNARLTGLTEVVPQDASYYLLITGTTAALTDIVLVGIVLDILEA
jgi:hypothetical protein